MKRRLNLRRETLRQLTDCGSAICGAATGSLVFCASKDIPCPTAQQGTQCSNFGAGGPCGPGPQ